MRRWIWFALAFAFFSCKRKEDTASATRPAAAPARPAPAPAAGLDEALARAQILDLGYTVSPRSLHWPGPGYKPFSSSVLATLEKDGVLSKAFCTPEHLSTHLDAPNHFAAGQKSAGDIAAQDLVGRAVVIDLRARAEKDPDAMLTVEEIQAWEASYDRIPERSVVFLRTGWASRAGDFDRYKNAGDDGKLHFPGYSAAAARFLVLERNVLGLGIDTLSIDRGLSSGFEVHKIVNGTNRYGLENVANLDRLPARGAWVVVAPMKIEGGSGSPARIFALLPQTT